MIAELPLPRGDNYSKTEVIELALLYGKAAVVKAIIEAKSYQKRSALYKFFPDGEEDCYDDGTVRALMAKYTVGSAEWHERAEVIASSIHGPRLRRIYSLFGYTIEVLPPPSADAVCDAEVVSINAAVPDPSPPSALMRSICPMKPRRRHQLSYQ